MWNLVCHLGKNKYGRYWEGVMRIYGQKKDEIIRGWRKLQNEDLHNLYSSPNIIGMIKSRIMKLEKRHAYEILAGNPDWKRPVETCRCRWVGSINPILKWMLEEYDGALRTVFMWARKWTSDGHLWAMNGPAVSISICRNSLSSLTTGVFPRRVMGNVQKDNNCVLRKDSAPRS